MSQDKLTEKIRQARVLIVGDVMLDRYWFGTVERISPEAPVPVAKIEHIEDRVGGAGNVARNIAALGGKASLLTVVGQDEAADQLVRLLQKDDITLAMHRDPDIKTTVKLRVIAKQQQLIRADFEDRPSYEVLANKFDEYINLLPQNDIVILSDYGKGGLDHVHKMIEVANAMNKRVLIDPKGSDYSRYQGATLLTPNKNEFKQVVGSWQTEAEMTEKAQQLRQSLNLEALLITRSEEGMTLYTPDEVIHHPTLAREVYDVSGAGDTVIGTMGLMLAAGASFNEAIDWSNRAAGIVVGKLGTATVSVEELFAR